MEYSWQHFYQDQSQMDDQTLFLPSKGHSNQTGTNLSRLLRTGNGDIYPFS
jgi:hypothetical protein